MAHWARGGRDQGGAVNLFARVRSLPALTPSVGLLWSAERAYWLAVALEKVEAWRAWGCVGLAWRAHG